MRLFSASYLPGLAVPFNSPSGVFSFGKGAMTYPICRELHRKLPMWNFCLANQRKEQIDVAHVPSWVPGSPGSPALFSTQL